LANRSISQRFGIPGAYAPDLSPAQAFVAALGAMARIFFGSLLFAIWGVYSLRSFDAIQSHFWRVVILIPLFLLFACSFGALMIVVAAAVRKFSPRRG
jgi:hypothetical protein